MSEKTYIKGKDRDLESTIETMLQKLAKIRGRSDFILINHLIYTACLEYYDQIQYHIAVQSDA